MSHSTHKMLIEFDAAIDMEIGFANYAYILTNDPSTGNIFNISFLLQSEKTYLWHVLPDTASKKSQSAFRTGLLLCSAVMIFISQIIFPC